MERTSVSRLATADARRPPAARLRRLRLQLEPLGLARLLAQNAGLVVTILGICLAATVFVNEALARHRAFESNAYDLGFFDQIVWNTSEGRFFQTSFVGYNFLGQHFDPVLVLFAAAYRLGGNIEFLVVAQAVAVAFAALPLFLAARHISGSQAMAAICSVAFLLSAQIHEAVRFDFHSETAVFLFLFLGVYFLAAQRPLAACIAVLPLLSLKEDMALVVLVFAAFAWHRGHRRHAAWLAGAAAVWLIATVFVVMRLLHDGDSDLTRRYTYLWAGSGTVDLAPLAAARAVEHFGSFTLSGFAGLVSSLAFLPLLSPAAVIAAAPLVLVNGLSDHPEQSRLQLHYGVPALAVLWLATLLALERLRRGYGEHAKLHFLPALAAGLLLVGALHGFVTASPFSPGQSSPEVPQSQRNALKDALRLIPTDASVSAQSSILPHVSQRRQVYEFPDVRQAEYIVVGSRLPVSAQSKASGYHAVLESLHARGYEKILDRDGVQVWLRAQ
jgi:uncharacterized membrane protein